MDWNPIDDYNCTLDPPDLQEALRSVEGEHRALCCRAALKLDDAMILIAALRDANERWAKKFEEQKEKG